MAAGADAKDRGTGIYPLAQSPDGMKAVVRSEEIAKNFCDYLRDESRIQGKGIEALYFPRTPENVACVIAFARRAGKTVTVSGGRTGICAGAVPLDGGYLMSCEKMNGFHAIEKEGGEYRVTAGGGIRLSELNQRVAARDLGLDGDAAEAFAAEKAGYFYPPDPTELSASLGGTVATNASGARTLFFGPTRDYVAAIDVVLPSGELLRIRRGDVREEGGVFRVPRAQGESFVLPAPSYEMPRTKNSAGFYSRGSMDLIDLFIGSEGALGVVAAVTVRLLAEPLALVGGVGFFPGEEEALGFVRRSREHGHRPLALEYFDGNALALLEAARQAQGPTSEIPQIPRGREGETGRAGGAGRTVERGRASPLRAVYFESAFFPGADAGAPLAADAPHPRGIPDSLRRWRELIRDSGGDPALAWGAVDRRDIQRLKAFRHALPEAVNAIVSENKLRDDRIHKVGTDMAVPDDRLGEMMGFYRSLLGRTGIEHVIFGHIGNSHVHVNMLPKTYEELMEAKKLYVEFAGKAVSMGGSVSAEHGIGKLKKEYLAVQYPPGALNQMKAIKAALDPEGLLNPDDVL
jgi:D-lactate dehydrogenase (cytochrome)